jgi:sugar lactone lactonase YvrE
VAWEVWTPGRFRLGEGARWCADGLVFVDLLAGSLYSCADPLDTRLVAEAGVPLGAVAPVSGQAGQWIAAAGSGVALLAPGRPPRRLTQLEDPTTSRMNDAACDPAGRFWLGSMAKDASPGAGSLYRVDGDGTVTRVLTGLDVPNGPAFSADGSTMYLADSARGTITAYPVDPRSGVLGQPRPFARIHPAEGKPDGMTVDATGRLWVAVWGGGQLRAYLPDGRLGEVIAVPTPQPTSVAFGGGRVYVTTAWHRLDEPDPLAGAVLSRPSMTCGVPVSQYRRRGLAPTLDDWPYIA